MGSFTSHARVETSKVKSVDDIDFSNQLSNAPIYESNIALPIGEGNSSNLNGESDLPSYRLVLVSAEDSSSLSTETVDLSAAANDSSNSTGGVAVVLAGTTDVSNADTSSVPSESSNSSGPVAVLLAPSDIGSYQDDASVQTDKVATIDTSFTKNHQLKIHRIMQENDASEEVARIMMTLKYDKKNSEFLCDYDKRTGVLVNAINGLFSVLDGNEEDYYSGIFDIVYQSANVEKRSAEALKLIGNIAIELLNLDNYPEPEELISRVYRDVIDYQIGFESYVDPDTGITIYYSKNMNWDNQYNTIESILFKCKALPSYLRGELKSIHFYDTYNYSDFIWAKEYQMEDFTSNAACACGNVYIYAQDHSVNLDTLIHELAHTYDYREESWGIEADSIADSQLWADAAKADYETSGRMGVTDYAQTAYDSTHDFSEDFADAVSLYYVKPYALDKFPARKALLDTYLPKESSIDPALGYEIFCNVFRHLYKTEEDFNDFLDRYFYGNLGIMNYYPDLNYVLYNCGFYNLQEYDRKVRNK